MECDFFKGEKFVLNFKILDFKLKRGVEKQLKGIKMDNLMKIE